MIKGLNAGGREKHTISGHNCDMFFPITFLGGIILTDCFTFEKPFLKNCRYSTVINRPSKLSKMYKNLTVGRQTSRLLVF